MTYDTGSNFDTIMNEDIQFILDDTKEQMEKCLSHLEAELVKVRAGKASPTMLESILVDYYGAKTPLNLVASIISNIMHIIT